MSDTPTKDRSFFLGWASVGFYALLGLALEVMLAFKWDPLVHPKFVVRREMWQLAHAHGTLLGLVLIVLALSESQLAQLPTAAYLRVHRLLRAAVLFMPLGFYLGGANPSLVQPGPGIYLVPVGSLAFIAGIAQLLMALHRARAQE